MRTAKTLIRLGGSQVDLSLRWAHTHFIGFVMSRLIYTSPRLRENVFGRARSVFEQGVDLPRLSSLAVLKGT